MWYDAGQCGMVSHDAKRGRIEIIRALFVTYILNVATLRGLAYYLTTLRTNE